MAIHPGPGGQELTILKPVAAWVEAWLATFLFQKSPTKASSSISSHNTLLVFCQFNVAVYVVLEQAGLVTGKGTGGSGGLTPNRILWFKPVEMFLEIPVVGTQEE